MPELLLLPSDLPLLVSIVTGATVVTMVALKGKAILAGFRILISRLANVLNPQFLDSKRILD